jgi:hypothetical protein
VILRQSHSRHDVAKDQERSGTFPFTCEKNGSLTADEFRDFVRGEPRRKTKATPIMQIGDLVLYPMAKGGYDPSYRPYKKLMMHGKLIDALLKPEDRPMQGIKYSCFPKL